MGSATIWGAAALPAVAAVTDAAAVELGVKFTADLGGVITGIRFYKGTTNTGTHTGSLWSSGGTRLATATFTNETASGWQQVNFATPVAITAGTVYVASYHTNVGHYSMNSGYFASSGVDTPPLHALRDGASGGNSVYVYGASAFPTNTYRSSNYWVDVVFRAGSTPTATPTPTAGPSFDVSGGIFYYADGAPVPGVTLSFNGAQTTLVTSSDSGGQFGFAGVAAGSWQLVPQERNGIGSAVSALDAAYVLQAVAGLRSFDAFETLAGDVTGDGTLSTLDASLILRFTVGMIDHFPAAQTCGSDWLFVPQPLSVPGQRLVPPLLTSTTCQQGGIAFEPLQSTAAQQDFAAVPLGDCTGNWSAAGSGAALQRRSPALQARLGAPRARPFGRWAVAVYVDGLDALQALSLHVDYDPVAAELETVRPVGAGTGALLRYRTDTSGLISISLASAVPLAPGERPLALLVFRAAVPPQLRLLDALVDEISVRVAD